MAEIVPTYLLRDLDQVIPMDRDEFYDEQIAVFKKTGKPTRAIEIIQVLLFNPDGELILQKRSLKKTHNPGSFDKTVGGHLRYGDSPNYTVQVETLQELSVPAFVLSNFEDFEKTYRLLKKYTNSSALIQYVDGRVYNSKKIIHGEEIEIANKYHFYLGVYSGAIKPADREASGVLFYSLDDLEQELRVAPQLLTQDLQFFLKKYSSKIKEFLDYLD